MIVGEFPELQGIMGGEYAKHDGESLAVSQAIRDQYLPRSIEGELPQTIAEGQVLSSGRPAGFAGGVLPRGYCTDRFRRSLTPCAGHATAIVRILLEGAGTYA